MTTIHLDPITLIGRVYYGTGSYEAHSPFDAVFTVVLLGDGRAKVMAGHGTFNLRAYGVIARELREKYGVTSCEMDRHGRPITVGTVRGGKFGVEPA